MTREEEIQQKAKELAQQCFPDENNIWARPNYEAQVVKAACMEICKWADQTMLDRACKWWEDELIYSSMAPVDFDWYNNKINEFRKAMEENDYSKRNDKR